MIFTRLMLSMQIIAGLFMLAIAIGVVRAFLLLLQLFSGIVFNRTACSAVDLFAIFSCCTNPTVRQRSDKLELAALPGSAV